MTQQAPPGKVVLHCEIEVGGKTLWADTLISRRAWDVSDERTREAFREGAREALARAILRQCDLPVTVTLPDEEEG
jgi:hypothetical protein